MEVEFFPQKQGTFILVALQGGQGPGWHGSGQGCLQGYFLLQLFPQEWGKLYWSKSGSLTAPQKQ